MTANTYQEPQSTPIGPCPPSQTLPLQWLPVLELNQNIHNAPKVTQLQMQSGAHVLLISFYTQMCLEGVSKQVEPGRQALRCASSCVVSWMNSSKSQEEAYKGPGSGLEKSGETTPMLWGVDVR